MPPKGFRKAPWLLGNIESKGNGYRVIAQVEGRNVFGPYHSQEIKADADLAQARSASTQEEFCRILKHDCFQKKQQEEQSRHQPKKKQKVMQPKQKVNACEDKVQQLDKEQYESTHQPKKKQKVLQPKQKVNTCEDKVQQLEGSNKTVGKSADVRKRMKDKKAEADSMLGKECPVSRLSTAAMKLAQLHQRVKA